MEKKNIQIFLVDDHHVFREGIRALIESDTEMEVVGEASNGSDLILKMIRKKIDVLLLDIDMPKVSGLEIVDSITEKFPEVSILVFSSHDHDEYIRQMMDKGAKGYLLKSCNKEELFKAIKTVFEGRTYLSKEVSEKLINYLLIRQKQQKDKADTPLTKRELEVIKLVASGLTNNSIGERLNISHRTVDTHRRNIMEKLNLHNAVALANYVVEKGI